MASSWASLAAFAAASWQLAAGEVPQCPGGLNVAGHGQVSVVATQWNEPGVPAGPVQNVAGNLMPAMWGRAYFADGCTTGSYNNTEYSAMKLLGKRLSYTTDVSHAGCGCNAAMYLVPMKQNPQVSGCHDFYCDANSVCGVNCDEIDVQEANRYAFHSALHKEYDGGGVAAGYGGWVHNNNQYAWSSEEYGPGARCVDTSQPFRVSAAFPVDSAGQLRAMEVTLSQNGRSCPISLSIDKYEADPGFARLTRALAAGVTPTISYWKSSDMLWLDGPGVGSGPCKADTGACAGAPQFYGFSVEDL